MAVGNREIGRKEKRGWLLLAVRRPQGLPSREQINIILKQTRMERDSAKYRLALMWMLLIGGISPLYGQDRELTDKELRDEYHLWNISIPIRPYLMIENQFSSEWIDYRGMMNPKFPNVEWYDPYKGHTPTPNKLVLGDTINLRKYDLRHTIRPWPDSTYAWYDLEKIYDKGNYYLVEKKGNVFQRCLSGFSTYADSVSALSDTISVHAYSEYYPYDERFLYYYDRKRHELKSISGNIAWSYLNEGTNLPQSYILMRLAQYNVSHVNDYVYFLYGRLGKKREIDTLQTSKTHDYFVAEHSLLTKGRLLIKVPYGYTQREYSSSMELFYYTTLPEKTGDSTRHKMLEYHYTIPTHVKLISERYPKIRELTEDERRAVVNSNLRFIIEQNWQVPIDEEEEE